MTDFDNAANDLDTMQQQIADLLTALAAAQAELVRVANKMNAEYGTSGW